MPSRGLEPLTFASKANMISSPAKVLPAPLERFELPTFASKAKMISISTQGQNLGGQDFTTRAILIDNN